MTIRNTILVVADDANDRSLLTLMLEGAGFSVVHAQNEAEGMRAYQTLKQRIALVLTGSRPARIGALSLPEQVLSADPRMPIYSLSGEPWRSGAEFPAEKLSLRPMTLMTRISKVLAARREPSRRIQSNAQQLRPIAPRHAAVTNCGIACA